MINLSILMNNSNFNNNNQNHVSPSYNYLQCNASKKITKYTKK